MLLVEAIVRSNKGCDELTKTLLRMDSEMRSVRLEVLTWDQRLKTGFLKISFSGTGVAQLRVHQNALTVPRTSKRSR